MDYFQNIVEKEPDVSAAVAAIRTLMNILETFGDGKYPFAHAFICHASFPFAMCFKADVFYR